MRSVLCARRVLPLGCLVAMAVLAGCIDLIPVSPPPTQPAVLHLTIQVPDSLADRTRRAGALRVTATLTPGIDRVGRLRVVVDDTLRFAGHRLLPELRARGQRFYSADVPLAADDLFGRALSVQAPRLRDVAEAAVQLSWPILWREGEANLSLEPGQDLELRTGEPDIAADPPPANRRWSVALFHSGGWSSTGREVFAPRRIVVPPALLGAPGTVTLAVLSSVQMGDVWVLPGEYVVRLEMIQAIQWRVSISSSEASHGRGAARDVGASPGRSTDNPWPAR